MCESKIMQPNIFVVAIISSRCQHGGVGFNVEAISKTFETLKQWWSALIDTIWQLDNFSLSA